MTDGRPRRFDPDVLIRINGLQRFKTVLSPTP